MKIFSTLVMLLFLNLGLSQDYSKELFVQNNDTLPYRMLLPKDYSPLKQYPMIVFLHGSGERGSDNEAQLVHGDWLFKTTDFKNNYPAIVIFPQCAKNKFWANRSASKSDHNGSYHFEGALAQNTILDQLESLIDQLENTLSVNKKKIYIGGLSMGGMGTFEMVARNPNKFAAAFPICGGTNVRFASLMKDTPFWIFHGEADTVVPVTYSKEIYGALKNLDAEVELTLYPEAGHDSWNNVFKESGLMPWVYKHSR